MMDCFGYVLGDHMHSWLPRVLLTQWHVNSKHWKDYALRIDLHRRLTRQLKVALNSSYICLQVARYSQKLAN